LDSQFQVTEKDIRYEDNHLIAVQKPAGILVQGDQTGDANLGDLVKEFIRVKYNKPGNVYLATLHRLDRPVWGLVLFAKTSKAAERMSKAFQKGQIDKRYLAILDRTPKARNGLLESYLLKDGATNQVRSYHSSKPGSKLAETHYNLIDTELNLVELIPKTGRSHQLRVHCALDLKCPIKGDVKYGSDFKTGNRSLYLLAHSLGFTHPVTREPVNIVAELPQFDLWQGLEKLLR